MSNEEKRTVEMEVSHLKKYYKAGWHSVLKAVDDVSFRIYKGETLGLVGESGCGKTTMLRMINGLQKPDSGKVYAAGEDVGEADLIRLRRKIGYVIQNKGLFPHMTVEKNIIYVPVISGQKDKRQNRKLAEEFLVKMRGIGYSPARAAALLEQLDTTKEDAQ